LTQTEYDNYSIATDASLVEVAGQTGTAIAATDRGWKFTLPPNQKVLSDSLTFDNSVFFVAFSPENDTNISCTAGRGTNFLYQVDIVNGDPVVNNLDSIASGQEDEARRENLQQGGIAPTPTILFPSPDDPETCQGAACSPPPIGCVGVECFNPGFVNNPVRTLWTQDGIE
jgi:type IV pilus assembly protein PilY1